VPERKGLPQSCWRVQFRWFEHFAIEALRLTTNRASVAAASSCFANASSVVETSPQTLVDDDWALKRQQVQNYLPTTDCWFKFIKLSM
jgi:hypothetical protein